MTFYVLAGFFKLRTKYSIYILIFYAAYVSQVSSFYTIMEINIHWIHNIIHRE